MQNDQPHLGPKGKCKLLRKGLMWRSKSGVKQSAEEASMRRFGKFE